MMPMGTAPDAAGAQHEEAKQPHEMLRHPRARQDCVVLLVMVDDEKPQKEQSAKDAAGELAENAEIPVRACNGEKQKEGGGEQVEPAY